MTDRIEAIYEDGVLKLPGPLPLPVKSPVLVRIEVATDASDAERKAVKIIGRSAAQDVE